MKPLDDEAIRWAWALWLLYWCLSARATKKTVRRETLHSMVLQRMPLLLGYALLVVPLSTAWLGIRLVPANGWIQGGGTALCLLGLAYSIWSRGVLGSNWSGIVTLKEDHELVTNGPYAFSRHPIYTGLVCASSGWALEQGQFRAFLGLPFIVLALHMKLTVEERFMRERFGDAYTSYATKVKKLIPFIY